MTAHVPHFKARVVTSSCSCPARAGARVALVLALARLGCGMDTGGTSSRWRSRRRPHVGHHSCDA